MDNKYVVGYVVNVCDPLNYHIALDNPGYDVAHDTYSFIDTDNPVLMESSVYKCHIRNIRIVENRNFVMYKEILNTVINKINRQNGWVLCKIYKGDKFSRLIVDIFDPITKENFFDTLVNPKTKEIFERYI
jgi:hypothetical protein